MIRKISVQDVVSKHNAKSVRDDDAHAAKDPNRNERDFLIERLTRKHNTPNIVSSPAKVAKQPPRRRKNSGSGFKNFVSGKKWFWLGLIVLLVAITLLIMQFMDSAVVTITPKQMTVPINAELTAILDSSTTPGTISYQIITLSTKDSQTVATTGTVANTPKKASGQIVVFNSYSSAPQTLVKNTRFETKDGLIYRIQNTVSIPGQSVSGGQTVPGSVTVTAVADQTGSKYNIDETDFTIPGFKTDASRYAKIFGRSKTAMTGGQDDTTFGISDADRQAAKAQIETNIKDDLLRQVQAQKTADSIIFAEASKISFQPIPDVAATSTGEVLISEQGTISSVVFDKKVLAKQLLGNTVSSIGSSVEVQGMEGLHFTAAIASSSPIWQAKPFAFTLTGQVDAIGVVDTTKLMHDILGISRSDLPKVLSNYSTIDKANVVIRPPWKGTFPSDASKVKIEVVKTAS